MAGDWPERNQQEQAAKDFYTGNPMPPYDPMKGYLASLQQEEADREKKRISEECESTSGRSVTAGPASSRIVEVLVAAFVSRIFGGKKSQPSASVPSGVLRHQLRRTSAALGFVFAAVIGTGAYRGKGPAAFTPAGIVLNLAVPFLFGYYFRSLFSLAVKFIIVAAFFLLALFFGFGTHRQAAPAAKRVVAPVVNAWGSSVHKPTARAKHKTAVASRIQ